MKDVQLRRVRAKADPSQFPFNLTEKECRVVEALAEGGSRKAMAKLLCVSPYTVDGYLRTISIKAGVNKAVLNVARYLSATEPA